MSYDDYNRPGSATSVDGAVTNYTYTFAPNTQTATISTTVNSTTTTQWKTTTFDGFGRPIRVQTGHDGVAVTNVDTQYGPCGCSPLGKMTKTSLPYAPGATVYWTTNTYDGSGRTLTQTKPDGSVTTTSYTGNAVTVTDPAGKWKTYYSDMAGGLTTVVEPNPGNATNPVTYYYLNGAGQITQVSVQRNGVAQNRYFTWSGSDMLSSTTPEAGTVTYTYDGNHHVRTRTDAESQQTQYTYDAYERLIEAQHFTATGFNGALQQQTNQQVNYGYDVNPLDPGDYLNSWGRLTQVTFQEQTPNGKNFAYVYSYNQAGRVTANSLIASYGNILYTNLKATYAWDNQGRMTNLTYPSGTALAYQYDAMGRLSTMTSSNYPNNPYPLNPIATATYTAASQLNTLQYGVNASFNESRSYNTLMQLTNLTVSGSGSVNMQYNYTAGQNNGRVSQTIDGVLRETVNYSYDMWNRLTNATATNGSWGEAYTFDGFGNLTGKTPTAGSAPAMNSPADPTTNRPVGAGYDANGNPGAIANYPYTPPYVWDIENRLVTTQTVVSQPTDYTYDPWGRRMGKEVPGGLDSNGNRLPTPCEIYFYGATGQKLETYSCINNTDGTFYSTLAGINIYFGGKLLQAKGVWVATDSWERACELERRNVFVFPYGEERTSTADGREKFGTYTRDGFGQDYAEQRYYSSSVGAFWSPIRAGLRTADSTNPLSWNRYAYALGDPIGSLDPTGMVACDPDDDDGCLAASDDGGGGDDDGGGGGGDDDDEDDDDPALARQRPFAPRQPDKCPPQGSYSRYPTVAPTIAPTPQPGIWPAIGQFITSIPVQFLGIFFTVGQGTMGCETLACNPTPLYPGPPINYKPHTGNASPSKKPKHQEGQTRRRKSRGPSTHPTSPPRKRPPGWKGPWPPPPGTPWH